MWSNMLTIIKNATKKLMFREPNINFSTKSSPLLMGKFWRKSSYKINSTAQG